VPYESGLALAKEFKIPFMETSAVQGTNVDEAFTVLAQAVLDRLEKSGRVHPRTSLTDSGSINGQRLTDGSGEPKKPCCGSG
jgi:hypothetical protein